MKAKWKRARPGKKLAALRRAGKRSSYNISGKKRTGGLRTSKVHSFKVKVNSTAIDPSNTAGEIARQYVFQVGALPNIAEYQALFDTYKMNKVKVEFRVRRQPGSVANVSLPVMYSCIDRDGEADALITVSNLLQRENTQVTYFSDTCMYKKYYFTPRQLQQAISLNTTVNPPTVTSIGRYLSYPKWNDLQQGAGLNHYGLLVCVPGAGLTVQSAQIDVWVTFYFSCKNQI